MHIPPIDVIKSRRRCQRSSASQFQVTPFSGVSLFLVIELLRLHRRSGALEPDRKCAGRLVLIDAAACEQVQRWLKKPADLTLAELADL